jgi:hypothetical protein
MPDCTSHLDAQFNYSRTKSHFFFGSISFAAETMHMHHLVFFSFLCSSFRDAITRVCLAAAPCASECSVEVTRTTVAGGVNKAASGAVLDLRVGASRRWHFVRRLLGWF